MPNCCTVCTNNGRKKKGISFFVYPKDLIRRRNWLTAVGREDLIDRHGDFRICEQHFETKFIVFSKYRTKKYLSDDAFPSLNIPSYGDTNTSAAQPLTQSSTDVSPLLQKDISKNENMSTTTAEVHKGALGDAFDQRSPVTLLNQCASPSRHEIKVFCPKCNSEVSHTAQGIQEDQTKLIIARVYHYLEQEFQELKNIYENLDLTPLSRIHQRTAFATGVNETTVFEILKEEEDRNAVKQKELFESQRQAQRSGQDDRERKDKKDKKKKDKEVQGEHIQQILQENCSDDEMADAGDTAGEQSGIQEESEIETLVVKVEPPEYYEEPEIILKSEPQEQVIKEEGDPISVDVKTEHQDERADNANETIGFNEPDSSKRRGKKRQRQSDVTTQQHSQGGTSTTEPSSSVTYTEELDENSLLGEREVKIEKLEIYEEGFS